MNCRCQVSVLGNHFSQENSISSYHQSSNLTCHGKLSIRSKKLVPFLVHKKMQAFETTYKRSSDQTSLTKVYLNKKGPSKKDTTTFNISIYKTNIIYNCKLIVYHDIQILSRLSLSLQTRRFSRAVVRLFGRPGKDALPNNQRLGHRAPWEETHGFSQFQGLFHPYC